MGSKKSDFGNEASPGKIFIGGLAKDTTLETFVSYFEKYGEITDSVIMKDRHTGRPRGFGFITYADPAVVDTVIAQTHVINDKQVEIKRTIPKGASESKDFKTKKIFVGGIPTAVTDDEFKNFFSKYGKVAAHEIIREHATKRSRGFGFIVFGSEQVVDSILVDGNMIDMSGTQVEIKRAEPKKSSNSGPGPAFYSDPRRGHSYGGVDNIGGFGSSFDRFGSGGFGPAPPSYRSFGGNGLSSRLGGSDYGGYGSGDGGGDFGGRYGDFDSGDFGAYRGEPSFGYSSRYGSSYGAGLRDGYGATGVGSYGRGGEGGYGIYGEPGSGGGYESGLGSGYGGAGGLYGSRGGYSGGSGSRYHPYAR